MTQTVKAPTRRPARPKTWQGRLLARLKSERGRTFLSKWLPGLAVFAVVFVISYRHIYHAALMAGEPVEMARLYPIMIDCQMIVGAVWIDAAKSRAGKVFAFLAFGFGFLVSLAANIVATDTTIIGKISGVVTAVMLFFAAGTLHWGPKKRIARKAPAKPAQKPATARATVDPTPGLVHGPDGRWRARGHAVAPMGPIVASAHIGGSAP